MWNVFKCPLTSSYAGEYCSKLLDVYIHTYMYGLYNIIANRSNEPMMLTGMYCCH